MAMQLMCLGQVHVLHVLPIIRRMISQISQICSSRCQRCTHSGLALIRRSQLTPHTFHFELFATLHAVSLSVDNNVHA